LLLEPLVLAVDELVPVELDEAAELDVEAPALELAEAVDCPATAWVSDSRRLVKRSKPVEAAELEFPPLESPYPPRVMSGGEA
jgi:hypothetical protein